MKISTKGRYGLRAMLDLAIHSGSHVSIGAIAERQNVSANYLEQVFALLRKGGLVNSIKGAQGGYVLADKPANITVGKILRVLEGDLAIAVDDNSTAMNNNQMEYCLKNAVWDKLNASINQLADSITLEDLIHQYNQLNSNLSLMAYI
jgi:Rrf2 family cysteine metabolism transcriptional repressor